MSSITSLAENHHDDLNINDLGLTADLAMWQQTRMARRRILKLGTLGAAAFLVKLANGGEQPLAATGAACISNIPSETAGPYPADGSNASNQTLNVLTKSGIVRQDIRSSLSTGNTAAGVPTTIHLDLVSTLGNCGPLAGLAVYLWHCDRNGNYSMYSSGVTGEDYLRGVQVSNTSGRITFQTIFPGCYSGRWPHAHFEIYASLAKATTASNVLHTSQLAIPEDICRTVYGAASGYSSSTTNLSRITLATDNVFRDGANLQLATATGDVNNGITLTLAVGVAIAGSEATATPTPAITATPAATATSIPVATSTPSPNQSPRAYLPLVLRK